MAAALFAAEEDEDAQGEQAHEEPEEQALTSSFDPPADDEEANADESDPAAHPDVTRGEKPEYEYYPSFERSDGDGDDEAEASSDHRKEEAQSRSAENHVHDTKLDLVPETEEANAPREGGGPDDGAFRCIPFFLFTTLTEPPQKHKFHQKRLTLKKRRYMKLKIMMRRMTHLSI